MADLKPSLYRIVSAIFVFHLHSVISVTGVRHTALKSAALHSHQAHRDPALIDPLKQHQTLAKNLLQTGDEWDEDLAEDFGDFETGPTDQSNPDVSLVKKEKKGSEALNKLNAKLDPDSAAQRTSTSVKEVPNEESSKYSGASSDSSTDKTAVKLTEKEDKQSEAFNKLSAKINKDTQNAAKAKLADYDEEGIDLEELAELEEQALDLKAAKSNSLKGKSSGDLTAWEAAEKEAGEMDYNDGEEGDYETRPQFIGEESSLEAELAEEEKEEEQRFEDLMKEEAHQEALSTGKNPALLAHGSRNSSSNATGSSMLVASSKNKTQSGEAKRKAEQDKFVSGYEELADFDVDVNELDEERLEDDDLATPLTLPDDSIQRAINAHTMDPLPSNNTSKSKAVATAHEKGTLDTLKDLKNVLAEDELDDSLDSEKETEVERLLDNAQAAKNSSSLKVDKSTQQLQHLKGSGDSNSESATSSNQATPLGTSDKSSSVITQGVIMSGTIKDAVKQSSTAVRIAAIVVAAVAGVLAAWASIALYSRFRPVNSTPLPKVIEIGSFARKSPSYAKVKTRGEDQNSSNWQDWDDDWDDQAANTANTRRGSSVKQKRQQKWDDDW